MDIEKIKKLPKRVVTFNDKAIKAGKRPIGRKIFRPTYCKGFDYSDIIDGPKENNFFNQCIKSATLNFRWATKNYPNADTIRIRIGSLGLMGTYCVHWVYGGYYHCKKEDFFDGLATLPYSGLDAHTWVEVKMDDKLFIIDYDRIDNFKQMATNPTILLNKPHTSQRKESISFKQSGVKVPNDYYSRVYKKVNNVLIEKQVVDSFAELTTIKGHNQGLMFMLVEAKDYLNAYNSGLRDSWKKPPSEVY